jgi:hypothetical protein
VKRVLHLVRAGEPAQLADEDWVVYLDPEVRLADHGIPPAPPGRIDHDQLLHLIVTADLVITW